LPEPPREARPRAAPRRRSGDLDAVTKRVRALCNSLRRVETSVRVIFGCALASLLLAMTGAVAAQPALKRLSNGVSKATLLADGSRLVWRDAEGIHTLGDGKPWSAAKVVRSAPPA